MLTQRYGNQDFMIADGEAYGWVHTTTNGIKKKKWECDKDPFFYTSGAGTAFNGMVRQRLIEHLDKLIETNP